MSVVSYTNTMEDPKQTGVVPALGSFLFSSRVTSVVGDVLFVSTVVRNYEESNIDVVRSETDVIVYQERRLAHTEEKNIPVVNMT